MRETEKPFACTKGGCHLKFTNEDHLAVHRKKHDMVLNLGLASKHLDVADQTPTPTRFLRNCEEVGLFQDLQNVNPFEETFKRAIDHGKGGSLHIPELSSDDTLHTPHIFPHIEMEAPKFTDDEVEHQEFSMDDVSAVDTDPLKLDEDKSHDVCCDSSSILNDEYEMLTSKEQDYVNSMIKNNKLMMSDSSVMMDMDEELCELARESIKLDLAKYGPAKKAAENIKQKIKAAINSKTVSDTSQENRIELPQIKITYLPANKETKNENTTPKGPMKLPQVGKYRTKGKAYHELTDLEKRRSLNRAAQLRSRARKKVWVHDMEAEINALKGDSKKLAVENQNLRNENAALKIMLLQHKDCSVSQDPNIIEQTQKLLSAPQLLPVAIHNAQQNRKKKKTVLTAPGNNVMPKLIAIEIPRGYAAISAGNAPVTDSVLINATPVQNSESLQVINAIPIYASSIQRTASIISGNVINVDP